MPTSPMVWSFDTDGVLNYYPAVWLEFIAIHTGRIFTSNDAARAVLHDQYDKLKHEYRLSDFKYSVPVNVEAYETVNALKRRGDSVYICTSRPFARYEHMRQRSIEWLRKSGIGFDGLIEKEPENLKEKQCIIHIDDEIDAIKILRDKGIQCILYQREQPVMPLSREVRVITDLRQLLDKNVSAFL